MYFPSVPPTVLEPGQIEQTEVIQSQVLKLTCPATGIPPPKITWFINNQPIKNETDKISLQNDGWILEINDVEESDSKRYTCKAENEAGQSEKLFDVNVLSKFL